MFRFQVLGSFEVLHDHRNCTPTSSKARQVLALLLIRANQIVPIESMIEELWGPRPPRSAVNTAQTYIYQLRRQFQRLSAEADGVSITTSPPGYRLRVRQDQSDLDAFTRFAEQGRALFLDGRPADAAQRLGQALTLWRGSPLANVARGPERDAYAEALRERRMDVLKYRIQVDGALGRHRELLLELKVLVRQNPLDEWLHGQLIIALHAVGRRAEALRAFHELRVVLRDELGLDPSPEVCRIHGQILTGAESHPLDLPASVG
jgi:DNA-binding SARP family transcriptional activator